MSGAALAVVGAGMVSALGFNGPANWAAMRAKICGLRQRQPTDPHSGEPLSVGRADVPQWWEGVAKYADILAAPILECLLQAERLGLAPAVVAHVPVIVALSEPDRIGRPEHLEVELVTELTARLGPLHADSSTIARGRSGGVLALDLAARLLRAGRSACCIVAGVDSFLHLAGFEPLIDRGRLLTPDNSNGFFAGEAGAAVLVTGGRNFRCGELHVLGLGMAKEAAVIESDEPLRAEGLTAAIRAALRAADMTMLDIAYRLTDLNGERYKFKESMLAMARLNRKVDERGREAPEDQTLELWHPIEFTGEIGAAIMPCLLGLAWQAGRGGWAPGPTSLCHLSDDDGDRAAAVLRFQAGVDADTLMGRAFDER